MEKKGKCALMLFVLQCWAGWICLVEVPNLAIPASASRLVVMEAVVKHLLGYNTPAATKQLSHTDQLDSRSRKQLGFSLNALSRVPVRVLHAPRLQIIKVQR